jgi:hypothetical protein
VAAPLTAEDKNRIEQSLKDLKDAEDMVRRAKAAGLDMSQEEAVLNDTRRQLLGLKQQFFPTGRPE